MLPERVRDRAIEAMHGLPPPGDRKRTTQAISVAGSNGITKYPDRVADLGQHGFAMMQKGAFIPAQHNLLLRGFTQMPARKQITPPVLLGDIPGRPGKMHRKRASPAWVTDHLPCH